MTNIELIEIFKNLGFSTEKDALFGDVVIMSAEDAYVFSATTGAKYLFYINGVTMKGRSEVFIHRSVFSNNHLIYSPGLFSRNINGSISEGNSSSALLTKYPSVFRGNKKIIIADVPTGVTSNIESIYYQKIVEANGNVNDYVLYKNFLSNIIGESLQEYFASLVFINKGYLVENQTPWFQQNYKYNGKVYQGGIPDFSAFHCSLSNELAKYNFISKEKGISILLLPVIKNFRNNLFIEKTVETVYQRELLIGEAKTSSSSLPQAIKQLDKYNSVQIVDEFFTIIPNSYTNEKYGSLYIKDFKLLFSSKNRTHLIDSRTQEDDNWMCTYLKMLLLGNVEFSKIISFIKEFRRKSNLSNLNEYESIHLLDAVQKSTNDDFINFLKESI